jgi:hypothetical protein
MFFFILALMIFHLNLISVILNWLTFLKHNNLVNLETMSLNLYLK